MRFGEVLGHGDLKQRLAQLVAESRLPHAMLLTGPAGNGKLAVAIALAQFLHCEHREGGDSCGECASCKKLSKLSHPDLHFSYPSVRPKGGKSSLNVSAVWIEQWRELVSRNPYIHYTDWMGTIADENKQGNISRDECTQIIQRLSLKSYESPFKVMIIWMVEYLQEEGNRLLKLIEEPPEGTILILIADNPDLILQTIRSRCQLFRLGPIEDSEIARGLERDFEISGTDALALAPLSEGDYQEATKLVGQESTGVLDDFIEWMRLCFKVEAKLIIDWVEKISLQGRENQKQFLQGAQFLLREVLHMQYEPGYQSRLQQGELKALQNFAKFLNFEQLIKLRDQMEKDYYCIMRNGNPRIVFMSSSLSTNKILKKG
jgi:DNA polymerase III subunit delta'